MGRTLSASMESRSTRGQSPAVNEPGFLQAAGLVLTLAAENARLRAGWEGSRRQLADVRARIMEASDLGRRRLERDLHDGAQQRLTTIHVKLGLAQAATRDPDLASQLEAISQEATRAIDELRALARGIYPAVLRDRGVADALRAAAREAPLPVHVVDEGIGRCPDTVEAAIYFCSREAIENAAKHAGARASVTILLARTHRGVRFEVADDGVGMQIPTRHDGIGLISMRDRIGAVGGELEIHSRPGRGTIVRGVVPDVGRRFERPRAIGRLCPSNSRERSRAR